MSEYSSEKIQELQNEQNAIREKMDSIANPIIDGLTRGSLPSPQTLPLEYSKLDGQYWDINNKLWNLRSTNQDIVFYQELILREEDRIKYLKAEVENFENLEKIGLRFHYEDPSMAPIARGKSQISQSQARIKNCKEKLAALKNI